MAFAATLNKVVKSKAKQVEQRGEVGLKWNAYESKLLDQATELFRLRCQREASQRRCHLTASFEVLSREIPGFPSHVVKDSTYVVNSWGKEKLAEAWFYATHGTTTSWSPGAPVLFAEMLEGMMPKFLERLTPLGFKTCHREAGTWKVRVEWDHPSALEVDDDEEEEEEEEKEEKEEKENEEKANEEKADEEKEKKEADVEILDDDDEKKEEKEEEKNEEEKEAPTEEVPDDKENEGKDENGENKAENGDAEKAENGDAEKEQKAKAQEKPKKKKEKKKKMEKAPDTFAGTLTQLVADMVEEAKEKEAVASKWNNYESKLLDQAVELFKVRCTKEAEAQRLDACVSFEVLSREITDFPKRVVRDSNYFVEAWAAGVTAESWFFSTHGTNAHFNAGDPVLFAEVLECMMPKFVEKLGALGFLTSRREPGTWKVSVTWADPDGEPAPKKQKLNGHSKHH